MQPKPLSTPATPLFTGTSRRRFLRQAAIGLGGLACGPLCLRAGEAPSARLVAGVMGLGRGMAHLEALLSLPNVEVGWVCDVDRERREKGLAWVNTRQRRAARATADVREVLADGATDLLAIAAPNHWHTPAAVLACAAGKHVYVEKPGSHNAREAEWIGEAAKQHRRLVQLGVQRRSWPGVREMIERLRSGVIGRLLYARCYYTAGRGTIGSGRRVPVPDGLNFDLWQGPAPERPYLDNLVHYNWHWRWHWGGGELANNGVHALDLCRWGLGVDYPRRVTFNGSRYHFDDDQETPDTGAAVFDFGHCGIAWDDSSCVPRAHEGLPFVAFYGEGGVVSYEGNGYQVHDHKGNAIGSGTGPGGDAIHFENFVRAIREGTPLNAEIAETQKSTLLCHLGNIAYRTGHTLSVDTATGRVPDDRAAKKLWGREYRRGWEVKV